MTHDLRNLRPTEPMSATAEAVVAAREEAKGRLNSPLIKRAVTSLLPHRQRDFDPVGRVNFVDVSFGRFQHRHYSRGEKVVVSFLTAESQMFEIV